MVVKCLSSTIYIIKLSDLPQSSASLSSLLLSLESVLHQLPGKPLHTHVYNVAWNGTLSTKAVDGTANDLLLWVLGDSSHLVASTHDILLVWFGDVLF